MTGPVACAGHFTGGGWRTAFPDPDCLIAGELALWLGLRHDLPTVAEVMEFAALLVMRLEHGGFPLSDIASGAVEVIPCR